ncbi:hypothetical protein [Burkholderia cepacia]|uniref:hypothetical protein n=1 Tax=Burkholderia cepacia TaxID=292 RepID=UPI00158C672E|nr:hypothetical protein [Burkholderia cepacia]
MSDTGFGPALLVRVIEDLLYDLRKWRGSIDGTRDGIAKGTSTLHTSHARMRDRIADGNAGFDNDTRAVAQAASRDTERTTGEAALRVRVEDAQARTTAGVAAAQAALATARAQAAHWRNRLASMQAEHSAALASAANAHAQAAAARSAAAALPTHSYDSKSPGDPNAAARAAHYAAANRHDAEAAHATATAARLADRSEAIEENLALCRVSAECAEQAHAAAVAAELSMTRADAMRADATRWHTEALGLSDAMRRALDEQRALIDAIAPTALAATRDIDDIRAHEHRLDAQLQASGDLLGAADRFLDEKAGQLRELAAGLGA